MKALCTALVALLLGGCTAVDLAKFTSQAQELTVGSAYIMASQRLQHRLEAQDDIKAHVDQAAQALLSGDREKARDAMDAARLVACFYDLRLPPYLLAVYGTIGGMDGELDGLPVEPAWPPKSRGWECDLPADLMGVPIS